MSKDDQVDSREVDSETSEEVGGQASREAGKGADRELERSEEVHVVSITRFEKTQLIT